MLFGQMQCLKLCGARIRVIELFKSAHLWRLGDRRLLVLALNYKKVNMNAFLWTLSVYFIQAKVEPTKSEFPHIGGADTGLFREI